MFVVNIVYIQDFQNIEPFVVKHREFLELYYQQGYFLVSGPKEPRTGGMLIAMIDNQEQLEKIFAQDPYCIHNLARYEFTQFKPVKYHQDIEHLINN